MSCKLDLHGRDVHSRDAMSTGQLSSGRDATAAAKLEDIGAVVEPCVEIAHPVHDGGTNPPGPLRIAQCDRVVAASDDLFRFPARPRALPSPPPTESNDQTRSTTQAIAWPKPMHIVPIP